MKERYNKLADDGNGDQLDLHNVELTLEEFMICIYEFLVFEKCKDLLIRCLAFQVQDLFLITNYFK